MLDSVFHALSNILVDTWSSVTAIVSPHFHEESSSMFFFFPRSHSYVSRSFHVRYRLCCTQVQIFKS